MKKYILTVLVWIISTISFAEELIPVSYTTRDGAFIEEFVSANHWRVTLSEEDRALENSDTVYRYERELFATADQSSAFIFIDVLAFLRNERLRRTLDQRRGYLVELSEDSAVTGSPEGEEPGFFGRQWNNTKEAWEDNPWRVVAIGAGAFLVADYFIFDSGELNAWGLLGSTDSAGDTRNSSAADGRANESSNTIVVTGDNNQVNVTSNVDRGTTTTTDRSVSTPAQ